MLTTQLANFSKVGKNAINQATGMDLFDTSVQVLSKLEIVFKDGADQDVSFFFQYNPKSLQIEKSVTWSTGSETNKDVPLTEFESGKAREITISEIFFDTTTIGEVSVYKHYVEPLQVMAIARWYGKDPKKILRPPILKLSWGEADYLDFECVLTKIDYTFTRFAKDGTPVRATVDLTFEEYVHAKTKKMARKKQGNDTEKYTVSAGDTLHSIAESKYSDANKWKAIATANGLDDPHFIPAGTKLTIPKIGGS